jgi:hypothetical protein
MLRKFLLFLNLAIEAQNLLAHAFVALDEWQIPDRNAQQARNEEKENDDPGKLVPNAKVDVHWAEVKQQLHLE